MQSPLVSVVIVTRDRPHLFRRAIESVYGQDHRPVEVVVLDNAGATPPEPPPHPEGIELRAIRSPVPLSASAARNFAADHASGGLLAFLDDDDYFLPGKLSSQASALAAAPDAALCFGGIDHVYPDGVRPSRLDSFDDMTALMLHRPVHLNGLMIRTAAFQAERFDERMTKYVDAHLVFRLFALGRPARVDRSVAVWMADDRPDQLTNSTIVSKVRDIDKLHRNWRILCEDFADRIDADKSLRRLYYGKQSTLSAAKARPVEALRYAAAAWFGAPGPRPGTPRPGTTARTAR